MNKKITLSKLTEKEQIEFIKDCQQMIKEEFERYFKRGQLTTIEANNALKDVLQINWDSEESKDTIQYYIYSRIKEDLE